MFKIFCRTIVLTSFILVFAGCFGSSSVESGLELSELIVLDDDSEAEIRVDKGEAFGLDMPNPAAKGHAITGASFDPAQLRMESYLEYEAGDQSRIRYLFTAVGDGAADVVVRMKHAGGMEGIFRTVKVVVGGDSGGLF